MPTLIKALFSSVTGIFGGMWGYVAVAIIAAGIAGYSAQDVRGHYDTVKYQALQLADAKAITASLEAQAVALNKIADTQHTLDLEAATGAVAEARAQDALDARFTIITKEIPRYVTVKQDATVCVPFGLVRVLDATILAGSGPAAPGDLALPPGQSDDACSPIKASDLAASVAANYGTASQNAEQLNALSAWTTNMIRDANK